MSKKDEVAVMTSAQVPVVLGQFRLPYHSLFRAEFGIDEATWRVLIDSVFPTAESVQSIAMALSYCRERKLDVMKRVVNIVPMYSKKQKRYIETVWPGIAEVRTTAHRTGQYAGIDEVRQGPSIERAFHQVIQDPQTGKEEHYGDPSRKIAYPEWMSYDVYRIVNGERVCFHGPRVYWLEAVATLGRTIIPNAMWSDRPYGQLDKCAEAAALRRAFPEELGNMLSAEEMEGRQISDALDVPADAATAKGEPRGEQKKDETPAATTKRRVAPPPPKEDSAPSTGGETKGATDDVDDAATDEEIIGIINGFKVRMTEAKTLEALHEIQMEIGQSKLSEDDRAELVEPFKASVRRVKAAAAARPPGIAEDGERIFNVAIFYKWAKQKLQTATTVGELNKMWEDHVLAYKPAEDETKMLRTIYDFIAPDLPE